LDLIIETERLTPSLIANLCVARMQSELICDRCQDPDEIVVMTISILPIEEPFALCGACARELPRGFHAV
jgi:hypothetical protein